MSLLNSLDEISHGSISGGGGVGAANGGTTLFEMQAALIPDQHKFEYAWAHDLVSKVQRIIDSGTADQYFLYFDGVVSYAFESIDRELRRAQLRNAVRLTFENTLDAVILRIIPGPEHARVGRYLYSMIALKITSIPGHSIESIEGFGATLLGVLGVRSKEGDQSFGPGTRLGRNAWPSVMIEIGYSGGEDFFHLDAQWWLINSGDKIRFVILASITMNPLELRIECWRMLEPNHREIGQTPARVPTCVQDFNINAAGVVKSTMGCTELRIPYDCIFDERHGDPSDVVISLAELAHFVRRRFRHMEQ